MAIDIGVELHGIQKHTAAVPHPWLVDAHVLVFFLKFMLLSFFKKTQAVKLFLFGLLAKASL